MPPLEEQPPYLLMSLKEQLLHRFGDAETIKLTPDVFELDEKNIPCPYEINEDAFSIFIKFLTLPPTKLKLKKIIIEGIRLGQKEVLLFLKTITDEYDGKAEFKFSLINCGLTEKAFETIAYFIHAPNNFSEIDLSDNDIEDIKGALTYLAASIMGNGTLKRLVLGNTLNTAKKIEKIENKAPVSYECTNKKISEENEDEVESKKIVEVTCDSEDEEKEEKIEEVTGGSVEEDDNEDKQDVIGDSEENDHEKNNDEGIEEENITEIAKDNNQNLNDNDPKLTDKEKEIVNIFVALLHSEITKAEIPEEWKKNNRLFKILAHMLYHMYSTDSKKFVRLLNALVFYQSELFGFGLSYSFNHGGRRDDPEHLKVMELIERAYKNLWLIKQQFTKEFTKEIDFGSEGEKSSFKFFDKKDKKPDTQKGAYNLGL